MNDDEGLTIILPTYREGGNIQSMLATLSSLYPGSSIAVVDDGSRDGTQEKVLHFSTQMPNVRLIVRDPGDRGLTASIMDGIMSVRTERFVVMDADFQHPPASVRGLDDALLEGNDLVIGVRRDRSELSPGRRLASWGADIMANTYLRLRRQPTSKDIMTGFFGGRAKLCQEVIGEHGHKFERKGFKVLFDLMKYLPRQMRIAEVDFTFDSRRSGESKLSSNIVLSMMRQCGIFGKLAACSVHFIMINVLGRFLSAVSLGLIFTFWVMGLLGIVHDPNLVTSTVLTFIVAMSYLVIANKYLLTNGRRDGLILGAKLAFTALSGYLIVLYIFYIAFSAPLTALNLPVLLGFGIGYLWNAVSSTIPDN